MVFPLQRMLTFNLPFIIILLHSHFSQTPSGTLVANRDYKVDTKMYYLTIRPYFLFLNV